MAVQDATNRPPREMPKFLNGLMALILQSPLHKMMSAQVMLLAFRGRKNGKLYTTPVGYARDGQRITVITDHKWWRNLRDNAPVTVLVQGQKLQGTANAITDRAEVEERFRAYLQRVPNAVRAFGVEKNAAGELDPESMRLNAQRVTAIEIQL